MYVEELVYRMESEDVAKTVERFEAGDFVRGAGEEYDEILVLLEGEVAIESVAKNGRILEIDRLKAVDLILPCVTFSQEPILEVDVVAKTDVKVASIDRDAFLDFLWRDRDRALEFFSYFGRHFSRMMKRLSNMVLNDLREKIASYILELRDEQGNDEVVFPVTREELARMFGATRPSVSRMLSYLVNEGLIEIRRNRIRVKDVEKLREIAGY